MPDGTARLGFELFAAHTGRQLDQFQAFAGHVQHSQVGDDAVHHLQASER